MVMKNLTHEQMDAEIKRREDIIKYLVEKNITDFKKISNIAVAYYKEPMETIQKIRAEMGWVTEDNIVSNAGGAKVGA
jgi:hypothetical protein